MKNYRQPTTRNGQSSVFRSISYQQKNESKPSLLNDRGVLSLLFEVSGNLYLERLENRLLMYLCRELDHPDAGTWARALDVCHWRHNHPFPVNPAVHQDKLLVFSVQLSEEEVTVPALEQVIQLLRRLHIQTVEDVPA